MSPSAPAVWLPTLITLGIVPDTVVYYTAAGVRHKRDEVLEKALAIAGCGAATAVNNVQALSPSVKVIPNPANDYVTVEAVNIAGQKVSIAIADVAGRVLLTKELINDAADISATFDTRPLPAGMYFVTLRIESQQYVGKIVKQ